MLYPNGSDLPLGHLIVRTNPFAPGIPWTPSPSLIAQQVPHSHGAHVLLEAKQTQSKHHPYCAAVWGISSMACIAIQFAQSQGPNRSCPGVASMQPPLVPNEIAYIQPQAQRQLFDAPNASSHLIFIGYLKPSNQDTLPHSTIETIQYRYPPSPHRA